MISKTSTRFKRRARERKLEAAPAPQAGEVVFMWGHEELVIRSEGDLRDALRRIGLAVALDTADTRRGVGRERGPLTFGE
jgi:hypothetical protein